LALGRKEAGKKHGEEKHLTERKRPSQFDIILKRAREIAQRQLKAKRRRRRSRRSRTNQRWKSIELTDEDLVKHDWIVLFIRSLFAWELGYIGAFFVWVGLALAYPIFAEWPYTLLTFEIVISFGLGTLATFREVLLRKIAKRGFVLTFVVQKVVFYSYYGAFVVALYPLLTVRQNLLGISIPPTFPAYSSLPFVMIGLFFFLIIPRLTWSRLLWEVREARLCILQFASDWQAGNPRYFWLRFGMQGVEEGLRRSGLSVTPGILYHGASYSLFRERMTTADLNLLAEWLIHPTQLVQTNSIVSGLIWESEQAEESGFGKVYGLWGRILRLPWPKGYAVFVAIGVIAGSIPPIVYALKVILSLP